MSQRFLMATDSITTTNATETVWYPITPYYYDYGNYSIPVHCEVCKGTGKVAIRPGAYYDTELQKIVYPNKNAKKEIKDCKACAGRGFVWVYHYHSAPWHIYWTANTAGTEPVANNQLWQTWCNTAGTASTGRIDLS